ncbi:phosphotransferase family protein [Streptomyces sp. WMMB 322]|uniref:phosphotransferase family protein n=1 Tax=Streptomyces sp. WMMB 322 TaxID=1286821 RepID=UPI0020C7DBB8|nr:aminoglycoside phosphotransferase family protein [Streptomyces sp. WMMB 322]
MHRTGVPAPAPDLVADRPDGTVVGCGAVVAKAHPATSEAGMRELTVRLSIAAHPRLTGIMPAPLGPGGSPVEPGTAMPPLLLDGDRPATLWPRGEPVDPNAPDAAPWRAAGTLLARLHAVPADALAAQLPGPVPVMRGPEKAARAVERMRTALADGAAAPALTDAAAAAEAAWETLPAWCRNEKLPEPSRAGTLCHGDFHLGQLIRHPWDGSWQLIDIDDLGLGDPAWDLARPAAWYATGVLHPTFWTAFLHAYQAESGTEGVDPWPVLDAPARALTVQTAALAVTKAHAARRPLDEAETACADACDRIAAAAAGQPGEPGSSL